MKAKKLGENDKKLCESALYREGSEACRNYSNLTMQVRTLAQQVLIGGVIALSVATLGLEFTEAGAAEASMRFMAYVLTFGGMILICFGVGLAFVDWHYQTAFTVMRDTLAYMEEKQVGPWRAHWCVRRRQPDYLASYVPFLILCAIGLAAMIAGFLLGVPRTVWFVTPAVLVFVFAVWSFWYISINQGPRDIIAELLKSVEPHRGRVRAPERTVVLDGSEGTEAASTVP